MNQNANSTQQVFGNTGWHSDVLQRTRHSRMSDSERLLAVESLRDGEYLGNAIRHSGETLRSAAAHVGSFFLHRAS